MRLLFICLRLFKYSRRRLIRHMETTYPIYFAITFSPRRFSFNMSYFSVFSNQKK